MVKDQRNLYRVPYLDNAIPQPFKIKVVLGVSFDNSFENKISNFLNGYWMTAEIFYLFPVLKF